MYVTVNFFDDHQPGEVFVQLGKHGSELSGMIDALAVTISISLRYGVPWSVLSDKYRHTRFGQPEAEGGYSSILDGIAKAIDGMVLVSQKGLV